MAIFNSFLMLFVCLPEGNYMGFKMIVDNEYGESLGEKWGRDGPSYL
jgi:hypothetical protein